MFKYRADSAALRTISQCQRSALCLNTMEPLNPIWYSGYKSMTCLIGSLTHTHTHSHTHMVMCAHTQRCVHSHTHTKKTYTQAEYQVCAFGLRGVDTRNDSVPAQKNAQLLDIGPQRPTTVSSVLWPGSLKL